MTRPSGLAVGIAIAATLVTLTSVLLPWISTGLGSEAHTYTGLEVPLLAVPLGFAALATLALALVTLTGSPPPPPLAVATSGIGALLAVAAIVLTETVALLIPTSFLPDTVARTTLVLGANWGLWLALATSSLAAIAMSGSVAGSALRRLPLSRAEWRRSLALLALATLTVLIGWLRYRAWIDAALLDSHLGLAAWAAPWVGPLSLVAVWMLVAALAVAGFHNALIGGLLAAAAGWLISTLAALVVVAVGSIGRLGLENLTPASVDGYVPVFHTTGFVWLVFLAGLTSAAIGALLVHLHEQPGGARSWAS